MQVIGMKTPRGLKILHLSSGYSKSRALQRQTTEISKQIFPEKEYRGLSPNFHIHVSASHEPRSVCLFCWRKYVDRSWDYTNRSQTHECWNWGWGRAIPRKGIHIWDFRCSVLWWALIVTTNKGEWPENTQIRSIGMTKKLRGNSYWHHHQSFERAPLPVAL